MNADDYNQWKYKNVEYLPDGNSNTVYSNYAGEVMLTVFTDQSTAFTGPDIRATIPASPRRTARRNQALVDRLGAIARRKGATPARIALAWLLARKPWIVPIPGTRRLERLEENIGAAQVDLTAGDLAEIETAAARIQVRGARYPEHLERMTGL